MKTIENILSEFTDTELAFLYKYQFNSYLADTQEKIKNYIFVTRKLNQESLENLITKNADKKITDHKEHCPRCKTDKLRTAKVEMAIPLYRAGAEDEYAMAYELQTGQSYKKNKITCNVGGYILYDPNNEKKPFYKKLADFFFDSPLWSMFRKD